MINIKKLLKTAFFLLFVLMLIPSQKGVAGSMNPSKPDLPKNVDAWTRPDAPRLITAETIFKYMNGAGELYLGYRFDRLEVFEYTADNQNDILVELYYMQAPDDAFGLLSLDWGGEPTDLDALRPGTTEISGGPSITALYGAGLLRLRAGSIYARVMAYRETPASKNAVLTLGQAITAGSKQPVPKLINIPVRQIDSGWKLREDRLSYFRSYLVLNYNFFLSSENILELDHATEALIAPYEKQGDKASDKRKRCQFLLVKYANHKLARRALEHFHNVYLPDHKEAVSQTSATQKPELFQVEDGWLAYKQIKEYLAFVLESPDRDTATQIIKANETKIH
jgi:hypothetical protein